MNKTLEVLVAHLGMQPTLELTRAWGGRFLYIPAAMNERHPIALTIGLDAASKLCKLHPGEQIDIPAERNILLKIRNVEICAAFRAGESVSKLSVRWGISRKMIRKVLDRAGLREPVPAAVPD